MPVDRPRDAGIFGSGHDKEGDRTCASRKQHVLGPVSLRPYS